MSPEVAAVIIATLASGVAAFGLWLRFRGAEQSAAVSALEKRLDAIQRDMRQAPMTPLQLPNRMSIR